MSVWLTFEHDVGGCGGHFDTRAEMLRDFPNRIICPSCPGDPNQERFAAIGRLGKTLTEFVAAKEDLEKNFNLKIIDIRWE